MRLVGGGEGRMDGREGGYMCGQDWWVGQGVTEDKGRSTDVRN